MVEKRGPQPQPEQGGPPNKWLRALPISARAGEVFADRDKGDSIC
jgi:hypothetical protein